MSYPTDALNARVHRRLMATGTNTGVSTTGDSFNSQDVSTAGVAPATQEPFALGFTTSTTNGNVAGLNGSPTSLPGRNIWWSGYASMNSISNIRHFIGLSNASLNTQGGSDAPSSQHYAGFVFTTDNATINGVTFDASHYWCVTNNGGSTPTITQVSTTVATPAAGTGHDFDIREDSTNAIWYYFIDGKSACTSSTTLPTLAIGQMAIATTLTTTAKTLNFSWAEVWSDR
ncbi:MAG TPA: hypothetical protein VMG31_04020 [Verrucomicrobiae bacterium]|nr:hypothetical protein [Verrucomicrobiae bacterium]